MGIILMKYITRDDVRNHPEKVFVFGDNMGRSGLGGQAAAMRFETNVIGIPTKWWPNNAEHCFFRDYEPESFQHKLIYARIESAFDEIKYLLARRVDVVVPKDGVGTGLADLPNRAPLTFQKIQEELNWFVSEYGVTEDISKTTQT